MEAVAGAQAGTHKAEFQASLASDRNATIVAIAAAWFGLLAGFIPDMLANVAKSYTYVIATHFHAASAVFWMALLTWQALLVRRGNMARHRANGKRIGRWLAAIVALSAVATVWMSDHAHYAAGDLNVPRVAFQVGHVIPFAILSAIGLASTDRPDLHKRMMLLGVFAIVDAGWSRWIGPETMDLIGKGPTGQLLARYPLTWALTAGMGLYDYATRGRLHPAYLPAVGLMLLTELGAAALYFSPWWPALALRLLGL